MGAFKDTYDIIKDLLKAAKTVQNQEVVQLAMDLQEKFFELREDNEKLLNEIKELTNKLTVLEEAKVLEADIEYYDKGFLTLRTEEYKIPYCSYCWKKEHKLFPLAQKSGWYQYHCSSCNADIVVMLKNGESLNRKEKKQ